MRLVVDVSNGATLQRIDYNGGGDTPAAFGVANVTTDLCSSGTTPLCQPFGFAGGLYDPDTGLERYGARDYDPSVGRWVSKDPHLFEGGSNLYVYAYGDPVNLLDPTGTSVVPASWFTGPARYGDWLVQQANDLLLDASFAWDTGDYAGAIGSGIEGGAAWLAGELLPFGPALSCAVGTMGGTPFDPDQAALVDLAQEAQRTGLTPAEAQTMLDWANEYGVPARGPEVHPGRPVGQSPHMHIGPVNHIPVGP